MLQIMLIASFFSLFFICLFSVYDAIHLLIKYKIHRLPVLDPLTQNVIYVLTHKRILRFLHIYVRIYWKYIFIAKSFEKFEFLSLQVFKSTFGQKAVVLASLIRLVNGVSHCNAINRSRASYPPNRAIIKSCLSFLVLSILLCIFSSFYPFRPLHLPSCIYCPLRIHISQVTVVFALWILRCNSLQHCSMPLICIPFNPHTAAMSHIPAA